MKTSAPVYIDLSTWWEAFSRVDFDDEENFVGIWEPGDSFELALIQWGFQFLEIPLEKVVSVRDKDHAINNKAELHFHTSINFWELEEMLDEVPSWLSTQKIEVE